MPVVFDVSLMQGDLKAFAKASSKFIENSARLDELQVQLATAVTNAKRSDGRVRWATNNGESDEPIRTKPSTSHRTHGINLKPLVAEVSFDFGGVLCEKDKNRLIVSSGGTRIKLKWNMADADFTECHFDIHPNKDGHPTLHVQFVGEIKEIPRIPSFFAHPLDILEFTLMEVFQEKWKRARGSVSCKIHLHTYPTNQRTRILSVMENYTGWLDANESVAPLFSFQKTPAPPFDLYPI
ncbi:MAG: hypothetical protein AB1582_04345 [Pseudomonadota bacterium]